MAELRGGSLRNIKGQIQRYLSVITINSNGRQKAGIG
jgi:hypothetical protein